MKVELSLHRSGIGILYL